MKTFQEKYWIENLKDFLLIKKILENIAINVNCSEALGRSSPWLFNKSFEFIHDRVT